MARIDVLQENMLRVAWRWSNWILPWDGIFGATPIRLDVRHRPCTWLSLGVLARVAYMLRWELICRRLECTVWEWNLRIPQTSTLAFSIFEPQHTPHHAYRVIAFSLCTACSCNRVQFCDSRFSHQPLFGDGLVCQSFGSLSLSQLIWDLSDVLRIVLKNWRVHLRQHPMHCALTP